MQAVGMHANLSDSKAAFRQKGGITHRTPVKMPKTCLLYTEGYQQWNTLLIFAGRQGLKGEISNLPVLREGKKRDTADGSKDVKKSLSLKLLINTLLASSFFRARVRSASESPSCRKPYRLVRALQLPAVQRQANSHTPKNHQLNACKWKRRRESSDIRTEKYVWIAGKNTVYQWEKHKEPVSSTQIKPVASSAIFQ